MKLKMFFCIFLIPFLMLFLITGCSSKKETVVIYSSMEENRVQALREQLKKQFPDIDVKVQSIATGNSAAKIKNEGTSIEADIVIDLETSHMENLKENFADLSDFDQSLYLDGINVSNQYMIWAKTTTNLIIDKEYFEKHQLEIPTTYEDLLKPIYKNLIAMPDPKTSGSGYAFLLNVMNIMGEQQAIEYFQKLKENLREFTTSGSGPTNLLKQGEIAIALGMTSQGVSAINEGYPFEIVSLKTGSPYNTTSAAIIKGRENRAIVKEIFGWLISDFSLYDKEKFMPDSVFKNQKNQVANYPTHFTDADMRNLDSVQIKERLMKMWSEIHG